MRTKTVNSLVAEKDEIVLLIRIGCVTLASSKLAFARKRWAKYGYGYKWKECMTMLEDALEAIEKEENHE
jgi:hypothetical protein